MIALGQFRDTFIIAMDDEGLCIIDQHVAHERVLFERMMQRLTTESLESQRLLIPLVMELPPAERTALVSKAAEPSRTVKVTMPVWPMEGWYFALTRSVPSLPTMKSSIQSTPPPVGEFT